MYAEYWACGWKERGRECVKVFGSEREAQVWCDALFEKGLSGKVWEL